MATRVVRVVGAAIVHEGRCLAARRGPAMRLAGYWEFPGGKIEPAETSAAALRREIREELGLSIEVDRSLGTSVTDLDGGRRVELEVLAARWTGGALVLVEHAEVRWCGPDQLRALAWLTADRPILPAVCAYLADLGR